VAALGDELLVLRGREELVPFRRVRGLDHDHPPAAVGILIDRLGRGRQLAVHFGDLARHGREEIGDGLDRLHDAEGLALAHLGADLGQLDEHDVAELLLRERRDPNADARALLLRPFMIASVFEIRRNVGHHLLPPEAV